MVEYCFETVNWSPYLGFERPDLHAMLAAAESAGFGWISFDLPSLAYHEAHCEPLERFRERMDAARIGMLAVHSIAIDADRRKTVELADKALTVGKRIGARFLHAGVAAPTDDEVVATTRSVAERCAEHGMELAIEFLPFLPLATIGDTLALLDAAGLEGGNLVIDSWHFFHGPDGRDGGWAALEEVRPARIAYVQFNDHGSLASDDLLFETTQKRLMPGAGRFDLNGFAARLRANGFDGIVGPELLSISVRHLPLEQTARALLTASKPYWEG